jgi:hypothetical protein
MAETYNIYCDESCHLEHDSSKVMALGAVWCRAAESARLTKAVSDLAAQHNAKGELKWNKVSPSRHQFYMELVDLFFAAPGMNFRCLVVDDKTRLAHEQFNRGSHDAFYYKMYYYLLRNIASRDNTYYVFLDVKDTRGREEVATLRKMLCRNLHDFEYRVIADIKQVRSHDLRLLQLADFLAGAIACHNRGIQVNDTKQAVIERIRETTGSNLLRSTVPWAEKFNLFIFSPSEVRS